VAAGDFLSEKRVRYGDRRLRPGQEKPRDQIIGGEDRDQPEPGFPRRHLRTRGSSLRRRSSAPYRIASCLLSRQSHRSLYSSPIIYGLENKRKKFSRVILAAAGVNDDRITPLTSRRNEKTPGSGSDSSERREFVARRIICSKVPHYLRKDFRAGFDPIFEAITAYRSTPKSRYFHARFRHRFGHFQTLVCSLWVVGLAHRPTATAWPASTAPVFSEMNRSSLSEKGLAALFHPKVSCN